jgi:putative proteasome-type protease
MTAGNLAGQAVVGNLEELAAPEDRRFAARAADDVSGRGRRASCCARPCATQDENGSRAKALHLDDPRRADQGHGPRLFMIYPEGNFIEASFDTPFFRSARPSTDGRS